MNVKELIDTISQFAFGTIATDRQRKEYLRCLNFANNDIYLKLRNSINFSKYNTYVVLLSENEYSTEFDSRNYILKAIYNKGQKLSSFDLVTNDNLTISEKQYLSRPLEKKIIFGAREFDKDSAGNNIIKIFYLEPLKTLVEVISDANTETSNHIYDAATEQLLVLGALYYIYLSSNAHINKITTSFSLYKEKLADILKFYSN